MKDLVNKNYDLSFILGADDIYIKYSFGIALLVKKNFKLGFGYSVNKNSELGDNTSLMLGWNFGQLELKKHEKYAKLEEQGEELYQKGKWNEALVKWKKAYEIYPQKITKAKTSYNLLSNEIKKRIKYSEKLFLKNESYFEKGKFHFFNKRYNKAIQYFSKIKYNDDEKNSVIFDKANLFIEKITKIFQGDKTTKLLKKEILEKENQEKNSLIKKRKISKKFEKEIIEVINNFIKLDRPDMAENHLLRFYELLSDTSIKQIKKSIFNKQISLTNREKLLEQFDVESKKLKDLYFTQKYPEVIDFFVKLEKKYKLYDFIDLSKLRMFFNLAKSKIDMQLSEKNSLKNYDPEKDYMTAAKFYLNYLKSNDIRELEKSIKLFENILKVYPEHNCKKDYLRAKAIYRSLTE
jgi:tetratricopeptide (TPR) repeat protein